MFEIGDYQITRILTGGKWRENCYIIRHISLNEQVVVDPGDSADTITEVLQQGGGKLKYILLTHAHHDHVGAVNVISERFSLSCHLHKADVRLLYHAPMYALRFANRHIVTPQRFHAYIGEPEFEFDEHPIKVFYTPGHTRGSVCYYFKGFVFTGDTLLNKRIGRTDLPGSDKSLLNHSITELIEKLPKDTLIFPGHGKAWTVEAARAWWQQLSTSPPEYNQFES